MAVAKIYNSQTGQWEAVIVGATGDTGVVQSDTEPSNTDQLWLDTDDTAEPLAIPAGGSAGQILQKSTDGDYDTAWSNVPSHNYIINGAFDIWQRGTSFSNPNSDFTADRWKAVLAGISGATYSYSQQALTAGDIEAIGFGESQYFLRMAITTAGDLTVCSARHQIEDVRTLAGQTVTLSFWAKSDSNRTIGPRFDQFFAGGSSSTFTTFTSVTTTTEWARYSVTGTIPSVNGKTINAGSHLQLVLGISIADGSTVDIWGVQLEAGSIATPFKRNANSIQGELAACQRYFQKSYNVDVAPATNTTTGAIYWYLGQSGTSANKGGNSFFKVSMRATPTVTIYSSAGVINQFDNGGSANVILAGTEAVTVYHAATATAEVRGQWVAEAEL